MVGLRTRFVFLLFVYFAGFATAVYVLSPSSEAGDSGQSIKNVLNSGQFAEAVNTGMHKCMDLGKDIAGRASILIKEKLEEVQANKASGDHS